MNKLLSIVAGCLCGTVVTYASETNLWEMNNDNDTIVIHNPQKVTVISSDSLQRVLIEGSKEDKDYRYENTIQLVDSNYVSNVSVNSDRWDFSFPLSSRKDKNYENTITAHFGVGFCQAIGAPEDMDIDMNDSKELFWTLAQYNFSPKGTPHTFSIGYTFDWRNYRMTGHQRFMKTTDDRVIIAPYESDEIRKQFSRIHIFSMQIPLSYTVKIAKDFSIGLGPVVSFNLSSSLKTKYKLDGIKHTEKEKNARVNPVTIDFKMNLNLPILNLYFKYSPCDVLKSDYAPKFKSLSVGIYI